MPEPIEYKKNLFITPVPNSSFYEVKFQGGGEVPDDLKGKFTSLKRAEEAIDRMYVVRSRKPAKVQSQ